MNEVPVRVAVNTDEVAEAIKKVKRLKRLLKEANSLVRELASSEVVLELNIKF